MNCRLKVKSEINKEQFFSTISELLDLTNQENKPGDLGRGAGGTNVDENL